VVVVVVVVSVLAFFALVESLLETKGLAALERLPEFDSEFEPYRRPCNSETLMTVQCFLPG
jgi:hypothetical protein